MTTPSAIVAALAANRYNTNNEAQLQLAIEQILTAAAIAFEREVRLDDAGRIDFLAGDVGIEIKVDGSLSALTRQLHRYAQHERIEHLIAVTSLHRLGRLPAELCGKPLWVVKVGVPW